MPGRETRRDPGKLHSGFWRCHLLCTLRENAAKPVMMCQETKAFQTHEHRQAASCSQLYIADHPQESLLARWLMYTL